jgi:hypothetical protein
MSSDDLSFDIDGLPIRNTDDLIIQKGSFVIFTNLYTKCDYYKKHEFSPAVVIEIIPVIFPGEEFIDIKFTGWEYPISVHVRDVYLV